MNKPFQPFKLTSKKAKQVFGKTGKAGWTYWSTESCAVGPFKTKEEALSDAISYTQYKEEHTMEDEKNKKNEAFPVAEAFMDKIKKLEEQVGKLELMFATMIKMANPVAQPRVRPLRSGLRSGNIYQSVAFPGSPNAQEAQTPEPTSAGTAVDPRGTVRPPR